MRRVSIMIVIVVALLVLSSGVVYAKPTEWATVWTHYVRPGETVWCIARGYGVSPWAIIAHNGLAHPSLIHVGMVLAIPNVPAVLPAGPTCAPQWGPPPPHPTCTCAYYHTVAPGSNLFRISLHYGVSMWSIARCNGILNLNYIRAGSVLCIPCDP
jgi:spore germination protein